MALAVDDVRAFLAPHGLEVVELTADTSTAPAAAIALNTSVGSIVKSLVFFAEELPVLVLASGDKKVAPALLARHVGSSSARLARPLEVVEVTGYAVGGVPPVAQARRLRTIVDGHLLKYEIVYAAGGAPNAIFAVRPDVLIRLSDGEPADVVE
ncbi:MAG TPA: YbaK/EbsC family protein [Chloroflexota bacterium]